MESKVVASSVESSVTIAVMGPSSSTEPVPAPPRALAAVKVIQGLVDGGAAVQTSPPSDEDPVMIALPVSEPLVGDVPVALPLSQGRARGVPLPPSSGGRSLVDGLLASDLNAVPVKVMAPPTSEGQLDLAATMPVRVTVVSASSQGVPKNVLPEGSGPTSPLSPEDPVMIALPVSEPLVGDVPVALPLSRGRARGVHLPPSSGGELVDDLLASDLNPVPVTVMAPPTSEGLLDLRTTVPVRVTVVPPISQLVPSNDLPPVTLPGGGGGRRVNAAVRCMSCCREFAFTSSDIPAIVPPPGFTYVAAPRIPNHMPPSPPPAPAGASQPFPVCSDPSHFILTMQHMPKDVVPAELTWARVTPSLQSTVVASAGGGGGGGHRVDVQMTAPGGASAFRPLNPRMEPAPAVPDTQPAPPATATASCSCDAGPHCRRVMPRLERMVHPSMGQPCTLDLDLNL